MSTCILLKVGDVRLLDVRDGLDILFGNILHSFENNQNCCTMTLRHKATHTRNRSVSL